MLTVLHRLLLSNDDSATQATILEIVGKCALALEEKIKEHQEDERADASGDHAEEEIASKKSVVFSLLEICTFMVTKYASEVVSEAAPGSGNSARKIGI